MPAADELYLLFLQANDKCSELLSSWDKHFEWLDDVVYLAKKARGQAVIPKTPAPRRKKKKSSLFKACPVPIINVENEDPNVEAAATTGRAAPRAAAKAAMVKTKMDVSISLVSKIRRPPTPPHFEDIPQNKNESESVSKCTPDIEMMPCPVSRSSAESKNSQNDSGIEYEKDRIKCKDEENLNLQLEEASPTSKNEGLNKSNIEKIEADEEIPIDNGHDCCVETPKDVEEVIEVKPVEKVEEVAVKRSTRTKAKKDILNDNSTLNELVVNSNLQEVEIKRSTRTKKRVVETVEVEEKVAEAPTRVTRTKKRKMEEVSTESDSATESVALRLSPESRNIENMDTISDTVHIQKDVFCAPAPKLDVASKLEIAPKLDVPAPRFTRSKVKKLVDSDKEKQGNKSPQSNTKTELPKTPNSNKKTFKLKKGNIVQQMSPIISNRHIPPNFNSVRSKHVYATPSPSRDNRMLPNLLNSSSSSSTFLSKYNKSSKMTSTSKLVHGLKIIGSSECDRSRGTFLTKMVPIKPSKEDMEEKRNEELNKKKEREEEARRKKQDIMKAKMEEQKRKNEERVRKVQETRENQERLMNEARKYQEKEKRDREEKAKEEKERRKVMAIQRKQEEAARLLKQREQEEREQLEAAKREEQHKAEMMRKHSEKLEEQRKAFEKRKELEKQKERDELAKRIEQERRIERERLELDQLKLREMERVNQTAKELNSTYTSDPTPADRTYVKSTSPVKEAPTTYTMTPPPVKTKIEIPSTATNYNIEDLHSDDSTDDETAPKKIIPLWAKGDPLRKTLYLQEYNPPKVDVIFAPHQLLIVPNLTLIFKNIKDKKNRASRYNKRTSSAVWNTPPIKLLNLR